MAKWASPVRIEIPPGMALDETTAAVRTPPPVRKTLEHLLTLYRQPQEKTSGPWELQVAPDVARMETAGDLKRFLDAGLPPQGMTWTIRPAAGASGRFPVSVMTEGHAPVSLNVVLGNQFPPGASSATGGAGSPIRELKVVYPRSSQKPVFWQPLTALGSALDVGWLMTYLLAYLPVLFILQVLIKVA
jgi:hypothetical protein